VLALRLARGARPLVQIRRLLVVAASAGTGFLLLCSMGYAMEHQDASAGSALRLAWCLAPMAATVYLAVAVARTDPGTRPRSGLSMLGLGPGRLMALSAVTTALSTTLGSLLALLVFLHLRGDLTGMPFDAAAAEFLAADLRLPLPATLTLLALVPIAASVASALVLRPKGRGPGRTAKRQGGPQAAAGPDGTPDAPPSGLPGEAPAPDRPSPTLSFARAGGPPAPRPAPGGLPWGVAALAAGLAVESYANRSGRAQGSGLPAGVSAGWALTALGLALAGPAIAHLCGWLLQAVRPGAVRLLAGRGLQEEARRIGRPLGVVCAVASGAYATAALYADARSAFGPLSMLGAVLVAGCTVATLATAAVEAKQARADTVAALVRLGAPATMLRTAALLRAGVLTAVCVPLTWVVAELAVVPLAG
jgi:hypothetical protein